MDARLFWHALTACLVTLCAPFGLLAATDTGYRTSNFVVHAPNAEIARKVAEAAEFWREDLAMQWLGRKLPNWYEPCQVSVKVGQIGAGGATTFSFDRGEVFGWNMRVQGSLERILDSVIPHEVSHTIFACHFRRPLPRWADEGAATLVEHSSERLRQMSILDQVTRSNDRYPLAQLLKIDEYPAESNKVLALYAQGYSLADFLVKSQGDKGQAVYLEFLKDALATTWEAAFRKHYGYRNLNELETQWWKWVQAGSPEFKPDETALARANTPAPRPSSNGVIAVGAQAQASPRNNLTVRGQSETPSEIPIPLPRMNRQLRPSVRAQQTAHLDSDAPYRSQSDNLSRFPARDPEPPARQNPATTPPGRRDDLIPLQLNAPDLFNN